MWEEVKGDDLDYLQQLEQACARDTALKFWPRGGQGTGSNHSMTRVQDNTVHTFGWVFVAKVR